VCATARQRCAHWNLQDRKEQHGQHCHMILLGTETVRGTNQRPRLQAAAGRGPGAPARPARPRSRSRWGCRSRCTARSLSPSACTPSMALHHGRPGSLIGAQCAFTDLESNGNQACHDIGENARVRPLNKRRALMHGKRLAGRPFDVTTSTVKRTRLVSTIITTNSSPHKGDGFASTHRGCACPAPASPGRCPWAGSGHSCRACTKSARVQLIP